MTYPKVSTPRQRPARRPPSPAARSSRRSRKRVLAYWEADDTFRA